MAIGLALMFGIRLPLNFNSPYKATSHHRFLAALAHHAVAVPARLPLHSARRQPHGAARATSTCGHDAARRAVARRGLDLRRLGRVAWRSISASTTPGTGLGPVAGRRQRAAGAASPWGSTFLFVVVTWVFFRSDSLPAAINVLSKMADPTSIALGRAGNRASRASSQSMLFIAWFAPNTQTIMGYDHQNRTVGQGLEAGRCARVHLRHCRRAGVRDLGIQQHSEFIYFRF